MGIVGRLRREREAQAKGAREAGMRVCVVSRLPGQKIKVEGDMALFREAVGAAMRRAAMRRVAAAERQILAAAERQIRIDIRGGESDLP